MKKIQGLIECARENHGNPEIMGVAVCQGIYTLARRSVSGMFGFIYLYDLRRLMRKAGMTNVEFNEGMDALCKMNNGAFQFISCPLEEITADDAVDCYGGIEEIDGIPHVLNAMELIAPIERFSMAV